MRGGHCWNLARPVNQWLPEESASPPYQSTPVDCVPHFHPLNIRIILVHRVSAKFEEVNFRCAVCFTCIRNGRLKWRTPAEVGVWSEFDGLPVWIGVLSRFTVDLKMVNASKSMVWEQLRFGAWNIRTVSCKEIELVKEIKKYRLKIRRVSEAKVRRNGKKAIDNVRCVF